MNMLKKRANLVKDVLDQNGCNYEIEVNKREITFSLEDKYNTLTQNCSAHFIIMVRRHEISVCGVLATYIGEDYRLAVSQLLTLLNKDLKKEKKNNNEIRFEIDTKEGIVGIRCIQYFAIWNCSKALEVAATMSLPVCLIDGCGEEILAVANGEKSAEEAYKKIANLDSSSISVSEGFLKGYMDD